MDVLHNIRGHRWLEMIQVIGVLSDGPAAHRVMHTVFLSTESHLILRPCERHDPVLHQSCLPYGSSSAHEGVSTIGSESVTGNGRCGPKRIRRTADQRADDGTG